MLVTKVLSPTNVIIQKSRRSKPMTVHVHNLKPCQEIMYHSWFGKDETSEDDNEGDDPGLPARVGRGWPGWGIWWRWSVTVSVEVDVSTEKEVSPNAFEPKDRSGDLLIAVGGTAAADNLPNAGRQTFYLFASCPFPLGSSGTGDLDDWSASEVCISWRDRRTGSFIPCVRQPGLLRACILMIG